MSATSDDDCPICLERMLKETWRNNERSRLLCCGKMICPSCTSLLNKRQHAHIADVKRAKAADSPSLGELQRQMKFLKGTWKCPMCMETLPSTDDEEVFQCVQSKAEQHGWDWAQLQLGMFYLNGRGVKADPKKAAIWFKKAAAQGNHPAEHELGEIYLFGKGVKRSQPEAVRWYQKAVDGGFALSQYALGNIILIDRGEGVPKNTTEGARLLTLSAEQGYPLAQCLLAQCYENGDGLEPSLDKSLYWNKKSADQGNATAMANYGWNLLDAAAAKYEDSVEVGHNPIPETMYWVRKSVAAGYMGSKIKVDMMEKAIGSGCANCWKETMELQQCSRCKAAMYCGTHCQKLHWKAGHKMDCVDGMGQKRVSTQRLYI
jgi:TPR repeat protein